MLGIYGIYSYLRYLHLQYATDKKYLLNLAQAVLLAGKLKVEIEPRRHCWFKKRRRFGVECLEAHCRVLAPNIYKNMKSIDLSFENEVGAGSATPG
jgi:hypothetical protein